MRDVICYLISHCTLCCNRGEMYCL